ncbi:hypothetical protein [Algivirga pacifica]|uniref:Uncharacterized protein n=1 Tax=Algivirga pacifica TaxID=1162670 RepID=A0ABP9DP22_9BACT
MSASILADTSVEQRFLFRKAKTNKGGIFEATRQAILKGDVRFAEADITHRSDISGGSSIKDLLLPTNDKVVGLSDLQGSMLDPGVNAAIGRLKVGYAANDPVANPNFTAADVIYSSDIALFPKELLNAKLQFIQDGKQLLSLPVSRFTTAAKSSKVQGVEDVLHLNTLMLLVERKDIKVRLEFSPSQVMPAGVQHFLEVRLMGTQTEPK